MGEWTLYFDWGFTGTYYTATIVFNADGTFKDNFGETGRWAQFGGMFSFIFDGTNVVYAGNLVESAMVGGMTDWAGTTGAWYAMLAASAAAVKTSGARLTPGNKKV